MTIFVGKTIGLNGGVAGVVSRRVRSDIQPRAQSRCTLEKIPLVQVFFVNARRTRAGIPVVPGCSGPTPPPAVRDALKPCPRVAPYTPAIRTLWAGDGSRGLSPHSSWRGV